MVENVNLGHVCRRFVCVVQRRYPQYNVGAFISTQIQQYTHGHPRVLNHGTLYAGITLLPLAAFATHFAPICGARATFAVNERRSDLTSPAHRTTTVLAILCRVIRKLRLAVRCGMVNVPHFDHRVGPFFSVHKIAQFLPTPRPRIEHQDRS